ncbi:MAG: fasciclin domain-containing protein [Marinilabiliaceae bacterium]|nr:fasciclin domain-containing protein [Marinilabiliaceae bacterium]
MRRKFAVFNAWMVIGIFALLMVACEDKDAYYERPSWLEPPIYQQLQDRGNFTHYLSCVDKAGYDKTLQGAGFYTVFAPNDAAFELFFKENGISSLEEIFQLSPDFAKSIVSYSLAVSAVSKDSIDDYQASVITKPETDMAFKRQTYYYKWVYEASAWLNGSNGESSMVNVVDMNAVESESSIPGGFEEFDNNRKHIPFFTDAFMAKDTLTAYDYNYFFPNTTLTDFNVADARVVEKDLWAENGIIHVVDKVILPLENLDELLSKFESCSMFHELLNKYATSYTLASDDYLLRYEQASGSRKDLYIKDYPYLNFALNCENYLRYGGGLTMDAYVNGWTLFAPTNPALQQFYDQVLFSRGYKSLDELPSFVLLEFINAHMFRKMVWPSKFAKTTNYYGEEARFDADADVAERAMASNGIFYAVNKVQNTDAFRTVLGDVILNPNYSLMYQALKDLDPLTTLLKNPKATFRLILISNAQFKDAGFRYNSAKAAWEFTDDATRPDLGAKVNDALKRFLFHHIILTTEDMEKAGFSLMDASGLVKTYENEEYIKFENNVVYAAGNPTSARPKILTKVESGAVNGMCYEVDKPLLFSVANVGNWLSVPHLINRNYRASTLLSYLNKGAKATYKNDDGVTVTYPSAAFNAETKAIKDIANTDVLTVFLPNDPAMTNAATDGVLETLAKFSPNGSVDVIAADNAAIEEFIKCHIIKGNVVVGDVAMGNYTTYRKLEDGTYATLKVEAVAGNPGEITLTDNQGRIAKVITGASTTYNILGNRCIVHLIDNYLTY